MNLCRICGHTRNAHRKGRRCDEYGCPCGNIYFEPYTAQDFEDSPA